MKGLMSEPTDEQEPTEVREEIVPGVARALSPLVRRILAENPGPETGLGTNTYLVGIDEILVIDPGPEHAPHIDAVSGCGGDRVRWLVSTAADRDDLTGATGRLASQADADVLDELAEGDTILGTEFRLTVHDAPGEGPGRRMLLLEEERVLFAGDLITEEGPPSPDDVERYVEVLRWAKKLRLRRIAPAHGHVIEKASAFIDEQLATHDG